MKRILLITNYWHFKEEKASSRYRSMADIITANGYSLEVITSSFRHLTKKQRIVSELNLDLPYKVTLLFEPGYKKNISIQRLFSHHQFSINIRNYLEKCSKPDLIIVSVPSLAVGSVVTKYANRKGIKVIIDIQDLWPESFKMAIDIPVISDMLFSPMMLQANNIYKRADYIMAVSDTFVNRGLRYNRKDTKGLSIYIGSDVELANAEKAGISVIKPEYEFWIGYVGALGRSYDLRVVIDAISKLYRKGITNINFIIMGDGPLKNEFSEYANLNKVKCDFKGFIKYGEMMAILDKCDLAVNPIDGKSVSSIINKVSDYAIAGVPVINTQNSPEYRQLLESYNSGINCINGDSDSVSHAIEKLYYNSNLREQMRNNSLKLGKEKFDRTKTYKALISLISELG